LCDCREPHEQEKDAVRKATIIVGAVTKFGRHLDRNLKSLVEQAVTGALKDAGIGKERLQGAWVGLGQNAGGTVGGSEAALSVTILKR